jgi:hypothetical protein
MRDRLTNPWVCAGHAVPILSCVRRQVNDLDWFHLSAPD